jgi:hypothetical protein
LGVGVGLITDAEEGGFTDVDAAFVVVFAVFVAILDALAA